VVTFGDSKEFGGIKKATKLESSRDGNTVLKVQMTEFQVLDKGAPRTFAAPD
jgi:hypothetical protein